MQLFLLTTLLLAPTAFASFFVTTPAAGASIAGNSTLTINWLADTGAGAGITPLATSFGATTVTLMTGSSSAQTVIQALGTIKDAARVFKFPVVIEKTVGPDSSLYFLRFQSTTAVDSSGVALTAFSARFELNSMTGTFSSAATSQNSGITADSAPVITNVGVAAGTVTSTTASSASTTKAAVPASSTTAKSAGAGKLVGMGAVGGFVGAALAMMV